MTAEELRAILDRLNLNQKEAAERLGVGYRTLQSWALDEVKVPTPAAYLLRTWARRPELYRSGLHERRDEAEKGASDE